MPLPSVPLPSIHFPSLSCCSTEKSPSPESSSSGISTVAITDLNEDCLILILSLFDDLQYLLRLKRVCKAFVRPIDAVCSSVKTLQYPFPNILSRPGLEFQTLNVPSTLYNNQLYGDVPFYWLNLNEDKEYPIEMILKTFPNLRALIEMTDRCHLTIDTSQDMEYESLEFLSINRETFRALGIKSPYCHLLSFFPNLKHLRFNGFNVIDVEDVKLEKLTSFESYLTPEVSIFLDNHIGNLKVMKLRFHSYYQLHLYIDFRDAPNLTCLYLTDFLTLDEFQKIMVSCRLEEIEFGDMDQRAVFMRYFELMKNSTLRYFRLHNCDFRLDLGLIHQLKTQGYRRLEVLQFLRLRNGECIEARNIDVLDLRVFRSFLKRNRDLVSLDVHTEEIGDVLKTIIKCNHGLSKLDSHNFYSRWTHVITDLMKEPALKNLKQLGDSVFEENECIAIDGTVFPLQEMNIFENFLRKNMKITKLIYKNQSPITPVIKLLEAIGRSQIRLEELEINYRFRWTDRFTHLFKSDQFSKLKKVNNCILENGQCIKISEVICTYEIFNHFLIHNKRLETIENITLDLPGGRISPTGDYWTLLKLLGSNGIKIKKISSTNLYFRLTKNEIRQLQTEQMKTLQQLDSSEFESNCCTVLHVDVMITKNQLSKFLAKNKDIREIYLHGERQCPLADILHVISTSRARIERFNFKPRCVLTKQIVSIMKRKAFYRLWDFECNFENNSPFKEKLEMVLRNHMYNNP